MEGVGLNMDHLDFYRGKRVFVTGHTGFKGSWICTWLSMLGAHVSGYSIGIPTEVSMFEKMGAAQFIERDIRGDITDLQTLTSAMQKASPEIVIHLAAQPIVLLSYQKPVETFHTNTIGTACVLEAVRMTQSVRSALIVTTDKCYRNDERPSGYCETDTLGGDDPYSASKACAELVTQAYIKSYFKSGSCNVATARAGNVIGGGDWAENRLIPDIIRSVMRQESVILRHPGYIRPWQHVMEPLNGYLMLCRKLYEGDDCSEPWNFGPDPTESARVEYVAEKISSALGGTITCCHEESRLHESVSLRLDCSKAKDKLGWKPLLSLDQSLDLTAEWYKKYLVCEDLLKVTRTQLESYMELIE